MLCAVWLPSWLTWLALLPMVDRIERDPKIHGLQLRHRDRRSTWNLHHRLRATPYRANRVGSLLHKAFALAVRWGWRVDNPVNIERLVHCLQPASTARSCS